MKKFFLVLLCVLLVFSFIGCEKQNTSNNDQQNSSNNNQQNSSNDEVKQDAKDETKQDAASGRYLDSLKKPASVRPLCLGTASSSGTWYVLGGSMCNSINTHSDWFTITCEASSGGGENIRNLQDNVIDVAMLNSDMGYFYYTSTDSYEGKGSDKIRSLFALPSAAMHVVVREDSDIHSIADLKGKNVAVGLAGSGYEAFASKMIRNAGLTYDDMNVQMINPGQMAEALQNKQVDAFFFPVNVPGSSITELAINNKVRFLSFDDDFRNKFKETFVGYVEYTIPAGTYNGQNEDIVTMATGQFVATLSDSLSEDEAYVLMCNIFDNRDEWITAYSAASEVNYDNISGLIVPLHKGAYKFLIENGVNVPDNLIPPEAK